MMRWSRVVPAALLSVPLLVAPSAQAANPDLTVKVVQDGLELPWDVALLPGGAMLYTERAAKRLSLREPGGATRVIFTSRPHMWASGETGLMSVELAPDFASTRDFITCHGYKRDGRAEVRVVRWHLNSARTAASHVRNLVTGLPATSGRHGGCALVTGSRNQLYIGTGDAATGSNPQSLRSSGGKVLRVDATTGRPVSTNPYIRSSSATTRRIFTSGHRNVQGLARRADGSVWSVEHGSYRDDEVNRLVKKGNYGWNPVRRTSGDPAYNEGANSPMTDYSLKGAQRSAAWRSGDPTVATSGAVFVGSSWGDWSGALAVTALKDESLRLLRFSESGRLQATWIPDELDGDFGRLRGAVRGPDGALYLTTSKGTNDQILKVTPSS